MGTIAGKTEQHQLAQGTDKPPGNVRRAVLRTLQVFMLLLCIAFAPPLQADEAKRTFHIAAQPLIDALAAFSRQSGISVGFPGLRLEGRTSAAVDGRMDPWRALAGLLEGTGLRFERMGPALAVLRALPVGKPEKTGPRRRGRVRPSSRPPPMEEIRITASKRGLPITRLPASTSLVTADRLVDFGFVESGDLQSPVAGFTVIGSGPGRNKLFLRGLSDGVFVGRTQSTIALYLDETPVNFRGGDPDLRLFDIDRVEVLRGPQGTLYGAGAIGGIVRLVSTKPALDRGEATARVESSTTAHGGVNNWADGLVNLPLLAQRLALRIGGYREHDSGFLDNPGLGLENTNRVDILGGKAALRWLAAPRLTADLAVNFQRIRQADAQYSNLALGAFERDTRLTEPYRDRFTRVALDVRARTDWGETVSATSFFDRDIDQRQDASRTIAEIAARPVVPGFFATRRSIRTLSHETRIHAAPGSDLEGLFGLFGRWRDEPSSERFVRLAASSPGTTEEDEIFSARLGEKAIQAALFGEVEWTPLPRFSFTLGLRGFFNRFVARASSAGAPLLPADLRRKGLSRFGLSPKVALSYRSDGGTTVYLLVSQGFRSGGLNLNTPVQALLPDPEARARRDSFLGDRLWNAELGMHGRWLDGRLSLDAAAYGITWRNIQTDQFLPNGLGFTVNAGRSRNIGIETQATYRPTATLTLSLNAFWNIPELRSGNPFLGALPGNRLPGVAEFFASGELEWHFHLGGLEGTAAIDDRYVGRSPILFDESASPVIGGYHLANARLSLSRGRWRTGFSLRNMFNSARDSFAFGNPFTFGEEPQAVPLRPRTIGIFVSLHY